MHAKITLLNEKNNFFAVFIKKQVYFLCYSNYYFTFAKIIHGISKHSTYIEI